MAITGKPIGRPSKTPLDTYMIAVNEFLSNPNLTIKELSRKYDLNSVRFSKMVRDAGGITKYVPDPDVFKSIRDEEDAYWLGFMYADGCVSGQENKILLRLKHSDYNHIEKFRSYVGIENNIGLRKTTVEGKVYESWDFSFRSEAIKSNLINLGCVPNKSLILKFPNDEIVPSHLKRHFMRGYIDGDGSLSYTEKTKCMNVIGTEDFILGFVKFFELPLYTLADVGPSKINKRWQCYNVPFLKEILETFYGNAKIYLDRKYDIYLKFKNHAVRR